MTNLMIDDTLAERLTTLAKAENLTLSEILQQMLETYTESHAVSSSLTEPLEAYLGAFDDDVSDLSMTVRETMEEYYRKKYGDSG